MSTEAIIAAIDQEILKLQQVRDLVSSSSTPDSAKRKPGRPKGAVAKPKKNVVRKMSAEGKARIATAQKARWAALKSQSGKPKKAAKKA